MIAGFAIEDRGSMSDASAEALEDAIVGPPGDAQRRALAKAITLLESTRADHRTRAQALLNALLPYAGKSLRIGITGVPGVGKSTFIEAFGLHLIGLGHRVAVLAIDPSSSVSGGSILGDKTRMERLSVHASAFVRPSPSRGTLGGVAARTREVIGVVEAAGYDVVIVETVGVGQSEAVVAAMTDAFVLLQLPNAGDDLQAIKKGVMELADVVVVNKADLDVAAANRARLQIASAFGLAVRRGVAGEPAGTWQPSVMQLSSLAADDIVRFWAELDAFASSQRASGAFEARRRTQNLAWFDERLQSELLHAFRANVAVHDTMSSMLTAVAENRVAVPAAVQALLERAGLVETSRLSDADGSDPARGDTPR